MATRQLKTVRPDAKGRITLGKYAEGVSSFSVVIDMNNHITLIPYAEIPAREKWLFENKAALKQVRKGLEESAKGKVKRIGSFAKYVQDKDE